MTDPKAENARIEALAEKWNSTPDYAPSDYDQGRVDQRHAMTTELLEALNPPPTASDQCEHEWTARTSALVAFCPLCGGERPLSPGGRLLNEMEDASADLRSVPAWARPADPFGSDQ